MNYFFECGLCVMIGETERISGHSDVRTRDPNMLPFLISRSTGEQLRDELKD